MSKETHIILEDASDASKKQFQAALDELGWGIVVLLGPESKDIFDYITAKTKPNDMDVFAVWAKEKAAVQGAITGLTGGDSVNFGRNGHRIVSINVNDTVCRTLSAYEATRPHELFGAILCTCKP